MSTRSSGSTSSRPADPVNPVRYRMLVRLVTSRASQPAPSNAARRRGRRPATSIAGKLLVNVTPYYAMKSSMERRKKVGDGVDGHRIAEPTEAHDRAAGYRRHHRRVAPRFSGIGVGDVQLDDDAVEGGQGVVDRPC